MTGEQALARIRSTFEQKIAETPSVQALIDKINAGKATFADTDLYARWAAINLGMCLSDTVCDIDPEDRPAVCRALLFDRYEDINGFLAQVQAELDSRFGIRIGSKKAAFPEERVSTIGHSLADPDKPDEVIRRRARSTSTVAMSFHDDYMKTNAKHRARLGLKCYITRKTDGKCCAWCTKLAGRYVYGEEPEDVYHRHDNCGCSVTYENGRERTDVWSKRTWTVDPKTVHGFQPTVLTQEQAQALQENALSRLTLPGKRDRIRLGINLFDTSDELYVEAFSIEEETGFTDVYLHGSSSSVQIIVNGKPKDLTPDEFERLLKRKGFISGDIRLCSCSTGYGDDSFAQQLSKIHNGKVKAPDSDVYYAPNEGTVFLGDPNANVGRWRIFENGDEVT